jgi:hypothetical protein
MPNQTVSVPQPPDDRPAVAGYIAQVAGDLAILARQNGLTTLGYLLDMAQLEAKNESQGP